ncbi:PEP-CTERM sorting domain-containing protein [Rubripirellula amarantea]|nr:PEP-CTERM sorting domain-containing protein [Rubripirellula amarantea]
MKPLQLLTLLFMSTCMTLNASAEVIFSDDFSGYTDNDPAAEPWTGPNTVVGGRMFADDVVADVTSYDFEGRFANPNNYGQITSGTVFAGFDLEFGDGLSTGGQYFTFFGDRSSTSIFDYKSRVVVKSSLNGASERIFDLGIYNGNFGDTQYLGLELLPGETYRVVQGYDFTTGVSSLSVNNGPSALTVGADPGNGSPIGGFGLRSPSASTGERYFDNMIVATTYNEAFTVSAVPEPSTALLGLVGLVGMAWVKRRRSVKAKANATAA